MTVSYRSLHLCYMEPLKKMIIEYPGIRNFPKEINIQKETAKDIEVNQKIINKKELEDQPIQHHQ